jgi:PAS domain S-box-containing protein
VDSGSVLSRTVHFGAIAGLAAAAVALSWRLRKEHSLRTERLLTLAGIVESTGDAVMAATLDRTITAWNSGAERLFGYTPEEMIGGSVERIAPAGLEPTLKTHLEQMLEKDGMHTYEVQRVHKCGTLIDVAVTLSPIRDDRGRIVGVSSILRDISDRLRLEEQREALLLSEQEARADAERASLLLEHQNADLIELDRMKDDFVASVSHELRTPLTSIQGYLELILEDEASFTADQRESLGVVQRNSQRLMRLVGDLLFVAQVDAGRISLARERVDLAGLIADCALAAAPMASMNEIALTVDAEPVALLEGDAVRLGQVVDNLLSNALKFTPLGGSVTLRVQLEGENAVIEVEDTGMGIAPEDQDRLFDRFFRTASATDMAIPGTGLGLAIVKTIVEGHGGEISLASQSGVGTTVRLELPVSSSASTEPRYVEALV